MSEKITENPSIDQKALKEKMDAMDVPGAMIEFDPEEAEELGCPGNNANADDFNEAVLASQIEEISN